MMVSFLWGWLRVETKVEMKRTDEGRDEGVDEGSCEVIGKGLEMGEIGGG